MKENFIIVDQDDNVMFGGQRYNERGANNIWESCNGIKKKKKGEKYIYIKEVEE